MSKKNWTWIVAWEVARVFEWPTASMTGQGLAKALRQSSLLISDHVFRIFPELQDRTELKPVHIECAARDLISLLQEIRDDKFWGVRITAVSTVDTYIVQKMRDGTKRVRKQDPDLHKMLEGL